MKDYCSTNHRLIEAIENEKDHEKVKRFIVFLMESQASITGEYAQIYNSREVPCVKRIYLTEIYKTI